MSAVGKGDLFLFVISKPAEILPFREDKLKEEVKNNKAQGDQGKSEDSFFPGESHRRKRRADRDHGYPGCHSHGIRKGI
jgi:hypothetical protein